MPPSSAIFASSVWRGSARQPSRCTFTQERKIQVAALHHDPLVRTPQPRLRRLESRPLSPMRADRRIWVVAELSCKILPEIRDSSCPWFTHWAGNRGAPAPLGERWEKSQSRNGASADGMTWHAVGLLTCKNDMGRHPATPPDIQDRGLLIRGL